VHCSLQAYCTYPMCVQCSHFHRQEAPRHDDAGDLSSEMWNFVGRETSGNLAEISEFHATLGIFYMPQIYDMRQTALLPLVLRIFPP
jgi:hypothetical protein